MDSNADLKVARIGRRVFCVLGLAVLAPAPSGAGAPPDPALDAFIAAQMKAAGIPGLAAGLARDGQVRLAKGYGFADLASRRPVTADTMFHIASVTKTVTATAIVRLAQAGKLDLAEPVAPHLDFPLVNPHHPSAQVTFRHLLTHTSGISDAKYYEVDFRHRGGDATLSLGDFLKAYLVPGGRTFSADECYATAPGAAWDYSNVGYGLLGYLASRIGGRDMRRQTQQEIFTPLGMRHTSWTLAGTPTALRATPYDVIDGAVTPVEPVGFPDWSAGMMRSSIRDLTRFAAASANGGESGGVRMLSAASQAKMLDMQGPPALPAWLSGQGLGWQTSKLDGAERPNHWGGDPGVFTAAYLDPPSRMAVVVLTNLSATDDSRAALKAIAARLFKAAA
jgi:CubicO group peptidase (beta-lactamase class C family)